MKLYESIRKNVTYRKKSLKESEGNRALYVKALKAYIKGAIEDEKDIIGTEEDPDTDSLEFLNSLTDKDLTNIANEIVDSDDFNYEWVSTALEFIYDYDKVDKTKEKSNKDTGSKVTEKQYMCDDCGLAFDEDELTSTDDEGNDLCPACGSTNITDTGR